MAVSDRKVPGWTPEFGERLAEMIAVIGSQKAAAKVAGYSSEQLAKHRNGEAKMSLAGAIALCEASGRSLDWLSGLGGPHQTVHGDAAILSASREAAKYILGAAAFFDDPDPAELADAIAKRTLYILQNGEYGKPKINTRLTHGDSA